MSKALEKRITKLAEARITTTVRRADLVIAERRKVVRYWCYRMKTEADGGALATGAPTGLRKHFEASEWFKPLGGWASFATKWDVDHPDVLTIVPRRKSVWQEWDEKLVRDVPILPLHVDGK
jgi:hypothetical protein